MKKTVRRWAALLPALVALAACSTGPTVTEPVWIGQGTEKALQEYLNRVGPVGGGAFAVSPNGHYSFYSYCIDTLCNGAPMMQQALQGCRRMAGTDCFLLANSRNVLHSYRVLGTAS